MQTGAFPTFEDRFLQTVVRAFERRRRAIRYRSRLEAERIVDDDDREVLALYAAGSQYRPHVILELTEGNLLTLSLRAADGRRRGKILVRINDMRIVGNAKKIVELFEWTMSAAHGGASAERFDEAEGAEIKRRWEALQLKSVD